MGGLGQGELTQQAVGIVKTVLADGHDGTGVLGRGTTAGLLQIALGSSEVVLVEGDDGGVEVGGLVVGIHADGNLEHVVIVLRAGLVGVGHEEHLVEAQVLRLLTDDAGGLLDGEGAHGVAYLIVGVAQGREDAVEHPAPLARVLLLELALLLVGIHDAVANEGMGAFGHQLCTIHLLNEPLPVLGGRLDGEEVLRQADEPLHVGGKGLGTGLCQVGVVLVGALGRGVAVDGDVGNRGEGVAAHHIDGLQHLGQLGGIAAVVGTDVGLVDHEVEEGTAAEMACLLLFGLRRHVSQLVMGLVDFLDNGWGRQLHRLLLADEIGNVQGQFRRADIVLVAAV